MHTAVDLALEWCTLLGQGTRQQFESAVTDVVSDRASAMLSALETAGHLEVDWERAGKWSVNPPVLALPEGSGGNACLVGGRTQATMNTLMALAAAGRIRAVTVVPGGSVHASTWFLAIESIDQLTQAAAAISATITVEPAALLMQRFVGLDHILSAHRRDYVPSGFRAKQLNVQAMRYEPIDVKYANWPAGCFEQLSSGRRKYIFVDDDNVRHVCDRWVATHAEIRRQRRAGRPVPDVLRWDKATERLSVHAVAQLPTYWARAAALCSGLPPRRVQRGPWTDVYEGVGLLMYGRFCAALDLPLTNTDLSEYDMEQR